jgi:subtilisin
MHEHDRLSAAPRPVAPRRERYLVASWGADLAGLATDPTCTVHRMISGPAFPPVAVVEMEADRAELLAATPMVHVEPDLPLTYAAPSPAGAYCIADPGVIPLGDETTVSVLVLGGDGKPLEGAEVYLMSETFPARGVTAADGQVSLGMPAGTLRTLAGVYVKPRCDYWAVWLGHPELTLDAPNLVTCPAFAETFPGFPERQLDGWARRALRFDALPPTYRGHGVKVAVIDSGAAVEHPDLADRFSAGFNARSDAGPDAAGSDDSGWRIDTVGHGSHTAAVIGGSDNGSGIVGVVPEAQLHSCKIFPGGRFGDLIEAIDYCIANQIDVVNLSLGSPQPSQLLTRKIEQARQAGIVCVAAAGNSGGPVTFPATLPSVLAVAAIGKVGEFPPETYHATQVWGGPTPDGYFSAAFTCSVTGRRSTCARRAWRWCRRSRRRTTRRGTVRRSRPRT